MASSTADLHPRHASAGSRPATSVVPAIVLGATFGTAAFAALAALALLVRHPDPAVLLSSLKTAQQDQGTKTALYLAGFGVLTPLAAYAGLRAADAVVRGHDRDAVGVLGALLAGALAGVFVLVRLSDGLPWGSGLGTVLAGMVLWGAGAGLVLRRATRGPWPVLAALAPRKCPVAAGAVVAVVAGVVSFTHLTAPRLAVLAVALTVVAVAAMRAPDVRLPALSRRPGAAVDVVVVVLLLLVIPDVVVFVTSSAIPTSFSSPGIIQFHQDFLLGPTNQVLKGGTLLVDAPPSQYGVGSVYFLAAWFHLAPIGYGTYALLDGLLTAGFYVAGYGVLRLAGVRRWLAITGLAVAVIAFVLALHYPVGALPQQGPLRFGLPMGLVLATAAALRRPGVRAFPAAALCVVGISAVWALEAFVYTALTLAALLAAQALLRQDGGRVRWLARQVGLAFAACVVAHVLFAVATVLGSGSLPRWGGYIAYLKEFLGGGTAGSLTYGFEPWSPGLPLAALYASSAIAAGVLLVRAHPFARRDPVRIVTIAGLTVYGIALFSYTQNRSSTYLMPYVALPALLVALLWVAGLLGSNAVGDARVRRGGLAVLAAAGLVLLASALPVGGRFANTALAHARPGGGLRAALDRLWHPPPIDPRAPEAQRLIERYMPHQSHVLVLLPLSPDLLVETLIRSDRGNLLPIGDPVEESFVPYEALPAVRRVLARLRPGDRALINAQTLATLAQIRSRPGYDPIKERQVGEDALARWILQRIGKRFDLRPIAKGSAGLMVAELVPRS